LALTSSRTPPSVPGDPLGLEMLTPPITGLTLSELDASTPKTRRSRFRGRQQADTSEG
jgi:hypothetical protein